MANDFIQSIILNFLQEIFQINECNKYKEMIYSYDEKEKCLEILSACELPIDNEKDWWTRYPRRAVEEIQKIAENTNADMYFEGNTLVFKEEIINNFDTRFLFEIETKDFPHKMPRVFVIEPKIKNRKHIWNDNSLCLLDPADYNTKMSILEFRNMTASWCFCDGAYELTNKWVGAEH